MREAIELAQYAEAKGAAGVMALSPYYYPAKDEECIYAFYKELSANTGLGILLYNNFEVMNIDCPISVLKRLKELPNVVGMTASEANQALTNAGLIMRVAGTTSTGSGNVRAISQDRAEGTELAPGSVVTVRFGDSSVRD